MKKLLFYGLASGFNRGGMFIILPLLSSLLSITDYGQFSIYIIIVQLLVPFISFNIASIIGREIFEKYKVTLSFVVFFNRLALATILICCFWYLLYSSVYLLIFIYALMEAIFLITSTLVRLKSSAENYFYICISKMIMLVIALAVSFAFFKEKLASINYLLMIFSFSNISVVIPYVNLQKGLKIKSGILFSIISKQNKIIIFAVGLLPHTLAQWVTSGADRFFVKHYTTDIQLGYYSYGYSIAAVYMVVNSALALGIPQICVQRFSVFSTNDFYLKYKIFVTAVWLLFFGVINVGLFTIESKYNVEEVYWIVYFVLVGMYFLSFYYYYSSFLFHTRKVKQLSSVTIIVAVVNILLVILLTPTYGIKGTALSTAFSYFLYTFLAYKYASKFHVIGGIAFPTIFIIFITFATATLNYFTGFIN